MEGKDDGPVSLGDSLHGTVDSAMRSLHIVFLHTHAKANKRLPLSTVYLLLSLKLIILYRLL